MRFQILSVLLGVFACTAALAAPGGDLSFTSQDMWAISKKMTRALRKCKPLRGNPSVIVEVQNSTPGLIDQSRFAEILHSMIEKKTHARPESTPADFEIRAKLESWQAPKTLVPKATYTLTARVYQAEEMLCEQKARISKLQLKNDP